ncbi:MAG: methionyl-tRNA formyltransferase [Acidimicrobiaceae bacterium]
MSSLAPLPSEGASRVVFLGTPEIAVPYLEALVTGGLKVELVVTRPDVRRGRGNEVSASPVKIAAQKLDLPVAHDVSDVLKVATDQKNLVGVVVAFGELISEEALAQIPMVNVHFSLLPRWRGAAPVERAILAGDDATGVCIMRVVEKLDEGEIYARQEVAIDDNDDVESLKAKLNAVAIQMLLDKIKNGFGNGVSQTGEPSYAKKIRPIDLQIDWSKSAEQISRQVRIGGAFTLINGRRIKVLGVAVNSEISTDLKPGQVCDIDKITCCVATGKGVLSLIEVQPEGKSVMKIEEWLNGARLTVDSVFGI